MAEVIYGDGDADEEEAITLTDLQELAAAEECDAKRLEVTFEPPTEAEIQRGAASITAPHLSPDQKVAEAVQDLFTARVAESEAPARACDEEDDADDPSGDRSGLEATKDVKQQTAKQT